MTPRRGEIWLIDFGDPVGHEQGGRRPGVIVSNDVLNEGPAELAIVVPMTTARRGLPSHIEFEPGHSGLERTSYAKCEDLKSISQRRLVHRIGSASGERLARIEFALRVLIDL